MQTRGEILTFVEEVFGEAKLSNGGLNAAVVCPVCEQENPGLSKKKLVIRTDDFRCHCWVCGFKGKTVLKLLKTFYPKEIQPFLDKFGEMFVVVGEEEDGSAISFNNQLNTLLGNNLGNVTTAEKISLPGGFVLLAEHVTNPKTAGQIKEGISYLRGRGMTLEDFWYYRFGVSTKDFDYNNRVIVPSFTDQGKLNFFTARAVRPWTRPKYHAPEFPRGSIVFNELNINWQKELTIVEGPFDMVKCGDNATCLLGSELTQEYTLFQKIVEHETPVLLALDNDAKKKSYKILKLLLEHGVDTRLLTPPDRVNDVGELTKEEVRRLQEQAPTITTNDLLKLKLEMMINQCS